MTHIPMQSRVLVYSDSDHGSRRYVGKLVGRSILATYLGHRYVDILQDDGTVAANIVVSSIELDESPRDDGLTIPECAA